MFYISAFDDAEGEDDAPLKEVISTLTLAQAEAVLKRVDQVRAATIQKRKIGKRLPDVRDVFPPIKEVLIILVFLLCEAICKLAGLFLTFHSSNIQYLVRKELVIYLLMRII